LSALYRKRAGGVMLMINDSDLGNLSQEDAGKVMAEFDTERVIRVAVEALRLLIEQDRQN
ncbi:MAG TPA: hypothetical protein DDW19_02380, partial [Anaerolineaceae bacterium]|nr:hypothetical protein [Anaerolineaceae bacterium]